MKNFRIALIVILSLCMIFTVSCTSSDKQNGKETKQYSENDSGSDAAVKHEQVCFEVENYGQFTIETYPEHAPETVDHFLKLVSEGFYDGFTFDQIVPGFKLQTSEVSSVAKTECSQTVTGEFFKNGISNGLKLTKGVLAMKYPSGEFNAAKAQFMIFLSDSHGLDGWFGGFACVTEGMDVIEKIAQAERNEQDAPISPIVMKKVYIKE